jgi:hypothetical protein
MEKRCAVAMIASVPQGGSMNFQIALSPDLGISSEDFVSTWNESPECRAVADARVEAGTQRSFELLTAGALLIGLVTGIATNALYDLIKNALVKKGVREQIECAQIEQPDGSRIIVVKMIKE